MLHALTPLVVSRPDDQHWGHDHDGGDEGIEARDARDKTKLWTICCSLGATQDRNDPYREMWAYLEQFMAGRPNSLKLLRRLASSFRHHIR